MSELFKKKNPEAVRSVRRELRLTTQEDETIKAGAKSRQLDVAEFIRRAALGRRADVNHNVEVVLVLRALIREINSIGELHKAMIERGITPPIDDWRPVKMDIRRAVERMAQKETLDFYGQ